VTLCGGLVLRVANALDIASRAVNAVVLTCSVLLIVGGPIFVPLLMVRYIRRHDQVCCPTCNANLLKKASFVLTNGCCYACGSEVLDLHA